MSWLFYKACPELCPWLTLNLLSPNLTMSASSCFYTHSCVSLQQLWRYSSIEWARSWVKPQNCKNKTRNTTAQRHTHKAFPKSHHALPCLFTLSQHCLLQLQSVIESQLEAQCSFILVFPLPGSSQQRPSNDSVWIWMNSNSILKFLSFQLRWETLHFLATTDLSPEATSWILSCSLGIQRIFPVTY